MQRVQSDENILFTSRDIITISEYLSTHQVNPINIVNQQSNNILHQLAFQDQTDLIQLYLHHTLGILSKKHSEGLREHDQDTHDTDLLYPKTSEQILLNWINAKNNQGFTPFLYAAYGGHIETMKLLEKKGANIKAETTTRLNALHLAAQSNQVSALVYLEGKINLNQVDQNNSTPLHWASYLNSESVTKYLLAQPETSLNIRDRDGQTPLMLATMYGNTRIVRQLLLKGANRGIPNFSDKIPIEVAQENKFNTIYSMLDERYTILDFIKFYCNVKIEYRPKGRSLTQPICFLLTTAVVFFFINFFLNFTHHYGMFLEVFLLIITLGLYFSLLKGPTRKQPLQNEDVLRHCKIMCFQCRRNIPKRGYHCQICKCCISQYDHHCTWINNCVGKRNIARFIIFLVFLILSLGYVGIVGVFAELSLLWDQISFYQSLFTFRYQLTSNWDRIILMILFGFNLLVTLFIFPLFALLLVQIKNLFANETTYEKLKKQYPKDSTNVKHSYAGKKRAKGFKNCRAMCSQESTLSIESSSVHRPQNQE